MQPTVEVFGLFAPLLPQHARNELDSDVPRKRQGIVPDFMVRCSFDGQPVQPKLLEVKTLHHGSSTYPASSERCHAVGRRAARLHAEYLGKARRLDQQFLAAPTNSQGPVESKLRSFGTVGGLVFGAWAEASADVHQLVAVLAHASISHDGRPQEATTISKAQIARIIWRRWGMAVHCANARLLLDRLGLVGRGAGAAAARRAAATPGVQNSASYTCGAAPRLWPSVRLL